MPKPSIVPTVAPIAKAAASLSLDARDVVRLAWFPAECVATSRHACRLAAPARLVGASRSPGDGSHSAVFSGGVTNPDCADAVALNAIENIRSHGTVFIIDTLVSPLRVDAKTARLAAQRLAEGRRWSHHGTAGGRSRVRMVAEAEAEQHEARPENSSKAALSLGGCSTERPGTYAASDAWRLASWYARNCVASARPR
jgi:hypothetical protein